MNRLRKTFREIRASLDGFMEIWKYGPVKTTVEIPDDLFREAKAKAAFEGSKLKDLVTEGLRLRLGEPVKERRKLVNFPLIKSKNKRRLRIPDDIAARLALGQDFASHEASLR